MKQFRIDDVVLGNRVARFLHSINGEEGKLWRRDMLEKATVFTLAEDNAFMFILKVFDNDPRIIIQETPDGTFGSTKRGKHSADSARESKEAVGRGDQSLSRS